MKQEVYLVEHIVIGKGHQQSLFCFHTIEEARKQVTILNGRTTVPNSYFRIRQIFLYQEAK